MANRLNIKSLVEAVELHEALADAPKSKVEEVVRLVFATISDAVVAGDRVAIPGFGTFYKYESTTKPGQYTPKFKAAEAFKAGANA